MFLKLTSCGVPETTISRGVSDISCPYGVQECSKEEHVTF